MITGATAWKSKARASTKSPDVCGNFMFNSNRKDAGARPKTTAGFARYSAPNSRPRTWPATAWGGITSRALRLAPGDGYAIVSGTAAYHTLSPDELQPRHRLPACPVTTATVAAIAASVGALSKR